MGITKKQETLLLIGGEYGAYAYRSQAHDLPSCAPRSGARTLTVHRTVRPCAFLPGEPEVIRWQNGAVSSLPAEAGELSHGTFHNSQARRDRSPSVGEAEGVNEENVGFEPQVGITKKQAMPAFTWWRIRGLRISFASSRSAVLRAAKRCSDTDSPPDCQALSGSSPK